MFIRLSTVLAIILALETLPSSLLAQQRVFARVEPNRDIAGKTASVYDSADGIFHPAATEMLERRENHTATVLSNGTVLIAGGDRGSSYLNFAEIFDPASRAFTAAGTMNETRARHTATLLQDGTVLITGGDSGGDASNTAEIYDPASGTFTATTGAMTAARSGHTATLLQDGKVLIAGGYNGSSYLSAAEIYDPSAGTFTATTGSMTAARRNHTATLLSSGQVLLVGGYNGAYLDTAETYNASTGAFAATAGAMAATREGHTASLLSDGKVLVAGGYNGRYLNTAEIYDSTGNRFTAAARTMGSARRRHTATVLSNGRVLIAGGSDGKYALDTSETFNPSDGSFSTSSSLGVGRSNHSATLLSGGRVLIAGGLYRLPLVFDVNSTQTDNISPTVVFSLDSRHGFVPYTGSGVVVVFSAETGEVLKLIETGGQPALSTLSADGRTLMVVSVFEDRIFRIDTESMTLTATYNFTGATFGFGSNVCLSADGKTGFISSTGSGEVIKFAVDGGQELGRMKGLAAPVQITLSFDGAIAMVVDAQAEELVFADTAALTRKSTLRARDKEPAADFSIFSRAVLARDGLTGLIASRDINGTLGSDTAFIFRASTGEVLHKQKIGSQPGFTGLTPDGTLWVTLNELSLSLIPTIDPGAATELNMVQGDPIGSANIVFSPDSVYAFYASSANDLVFQHSLGADAVVGQVTVGDLPDEALDQPSSLALAPAGKVLAVLNFMGNDLDLLKNEYVISATKFVVSPDRVTGITLLNATPRTASLSLYALNNYGEPITDTNVTNPAEVTLPPNGQISLTVSQLFGLESLLERTGWISVHSDEPGIVGYASIGRFRTSWLDLYFLEQDGFPLFRKRLYDWILPEVPQAGLGSAEFNMVNPNYNQVKYDASLISVQGKALETTTGNIAYPTNRQLQDASAVSDQAQAGFVLIAGGQNADSVLNTAETYSPDAGSFGATTGAMVATRQLHTATSLGSGKVLVAGGKDASTALATAELYDPSTGSFTATTGQMTVARSSQTATLLQDGRVLLAGGDSGSGANTTAELYDPTSDTFTRASGAMTAARTRHTATLLLSGKVLLTGGSDGSTALSSAEIYDPSSGLFTATGGMTTARNYHTATRLSSGKVLIVGGYSGTDYLATAELYEPSTGVFTATTASLAKGRREHTATLLPDGRVLIAGGAVSSGALDSTEIFDPAAGSFTAAANMTAARKGHAAARLLNDKVLLTGGSNGSNLLNTADLYDPTTGALNATGVMTSLRSGQTATLLQSQTPGDGYYRMTSTGGLLQTEMVTSGSALSALNGIDMARYAGVFRVYAPHFASTGLYRTVLNIINGNEDDAEVTIALRRADGTFIGSPQKRTLAAGAQLKRDLESLFPGEVTSNQLTGWIQVESTQDLIVGTVTLTTADEAFRASFELSGTPLDRFVFPVAAEGRTYQTGVALLNANDATATVTVELWGQGGTLDRTVTQTLAPWNRSALYLHDYFPGLEDRLVSNIRIRSDLPLHGVAILHDRDLYFMSAVPAMPLP